MYSSLSSIDFRKGVSAYIRGFILSAITTLASFGVVLFIDAASWVKLLIICVLAAIQIGLQSYYFLHIGQKQTPRWNTFAYQFMIMAVTLIVLGSLWVMSNLNYNMMHHDTSKDEQYIIKDEGIPPKEHNH